MQELEDQDLSEDAERGEGLEVAGAGGTAASAHFLFVVV